MSFAGGKVKPLKAAKKDKKELDEDELAFKEKQKRGLSSFWPHTSLPTCTDLLQMPRPGKTCRMRPRVKKDPLTPEAKASRSPARNE